MTAAARKARTNYNYVCMAAVENHTSPGQWRFDYYNIPLPLQKKKKVIFRVEVAAQDANVSFSPTNLFWVCVERDGRDETETSHQALWIHSHSFAHVSDRQRNATWCEEARGLRVSRTLFRSASAILNMWFDIILRRCHGDVWLVSVSKIYLK